MSCAEHRSLSLSEEDDSDGEVDGGTAQSAQIHRLMRETYPSMLMRHPRGTTNLDSVFGTPRSATHFKVTGKVAADEAVPHAVIHALEHLNQYEYGFLLTMAKKMMGRTTKRWKAIVAIAPPTRTPRLAPI